MPASAAAAFAPARTCKRKPAPRGARVSFIARRASPPVAPRRQARAAPPVSGFVTSAVPLVC
ncbi:hypothetical protein C7S16_6080 [Burkholderia thailandensis]|uniref:Uncharacterized protein n=1 Tax=Burkholderia thailandensis TaxID=57975 RepID=A0AAW9CVQ4_BURTH|nr:hypothetical protein [Burkholderia thailandensis]MDW9251859.1 hypothetical protein [Burkholderia thailandensis]